MNRILIASASALLLIAAAAAAPPHMAKADSNNDGSVSLAEFENAQLERAREHFARLDENGDGQLSADELDRKHRGKHGRSRHGQPDPERVVGDLDADASGGVSLAEFGPARFKPGAEAFAAADGDGNGELDAGEVEQMIRAHRDERRRDREDGE